MQYSAVEFTDETVPSGPTEVPPPLSVIMSSNSSFPFSRSVTPVCSRDVAATDLSVPSLSDALTAGEDVVSRTQRSSISGAHTGQICSETRPNIAQRHARSSVPSPSMFALLSPALSPSERKKNYEKIMQGLQNLQIRDSSPDESESKFCENEIVKLPRDLFDYYCKYEQNSDSDTELVWIAVETSDDESEGSFQDFYPGLRPQSGVMKRINVIDAQVRRMFGEKEVSYFQFLFDFGILVRQIVQSDNRRDVWSLIYMFLRAQGVAGIESTLLSFIVAPFLKRRRRIVAQSLSDHIDKAGDMIEYIFDGTFADAIKNLFISAAVLRFCDASMAFKIFAICGPRPKGTLFDITRGALKSLAIVVKAFEDMAEGQKDFHAIFFAKDPYIMAQQSYATLCFQKDRIRLGLKPSEGDDGLFDRTQWLINAYQLKTYLATKIKRTAQSKPQYLTLSTMSTNLDQWIADVNAVAGATYRKTPAAVLIYGEPGVGKSGTLDVTNASYCEVRGIKYDPSLVYHRQKESDFFDGYVAQPIGHWSEMGSENAEIAKKQIDKMSVELTSVIDSQPMYANQADIERKGKVMISFELVVADTNNKTLNFPHSVDNPTAYLRRFIYVTQTVKTDVRKDNAVGVDQTKAADKVVAGRHKMDMFCYDIEEVVVSSKKDYRFVKKRFTDDKGVVRDAAGLDIFEYAHAMKQFFREHITKEELMYDMRRSGEMYECIKYSSAEAYRKAMQEDESKVSCGSKAPTAPPSTSPSTCWDASTDNVSTITSVFSVGKSLRSYMSGLNAPWFTGESASVLSKVTSDNGGMIDSVEQLERIIESTLEEEDDLRIENTLVKALQTPYGLVDSADEKGYEIESDDAVSCVTRNRHDEDMEGSWRDFNVKPEADHSQLRPVPLEEPRCNVEVSVREFERWKKFDENAYLYYGHRDGRLTLFGTIAFFLWCAAPGNKAAFRAMLSRTNFAHAQVAELFTIGEDQMVAPYSAFDNTRVKMLRLKVFSMCDFCVPPPTFARRFEQTRSIVTNGFSAVLSAGALLSERLMVRSSAALTSLGLSALGVCAYAAGGWIPLTMSMGWAAAVGLYRRACSQAGVTIRTRTQMFLRAIYQELGLNYDDSVFQRALFGMSASVVLGVVAGGLYFFRDKLSISSKIVAQGQFADYQEKFAVGPSLPRRHMNSMAKEYGTWDRKISAAACTAMPDALRVKINRNVRHMRVELPDRYLRGYITGVKGDWGVTASHYFVGNGPHKIHVSCDGFGNEGSDRKILYLHDTDIHKVGDDVVLFRLPGFTFVDITSHLLEGELSKSGEIMVGNELQHGVFVESHVTAEDERVVIRLTKFLKYPRGQTQAGSCGTPIVYQHGAGSGFCAIHAAGDGTYGYASLFDKRKIINLVSEDTKILQAMSEVPFSRFVSDRLDEDTELSEAHMKSPFVYNSFPNIRFLGKLPGEVKLNHRSLLVPSVFAQSDTFVDTLYDALREYPKNQYGKPMMRPSSVNGEYINPYSINLEKANKEKKYLDTLVLEKVVDELTAHLVSSLEREGITQLNPLDVLTAINGDVQDAYLRRVDASTSAGFGFPGKKGKYICLAEDSDFLRVPVESVEKVLLDVTQALEKGEQVGFVYVASLKDEPREITKCRNGKTRVFFISPLPLLILQRMFLSPFYTLMVQHAQLFCTALGVAMHTDGHLLYERLKAFSPLWMEGDYGGYDMQMPFQIGQAASSVVYQVLKRCGYNESALTIVKGVLNEGLHPHIAMNGDLYTVPALQPSGKYATAEDNSLRGLVMLMYAWYSLPPTRDLDFFAHVMPLLYGDDMLASVKSEVSEHFNNVVYSDFVAQVFGMEFTTAQKSAVSEKFVDPDKASFLKRTWRDHDFLQRKVAALDPDSIYKMLYWRLPSSMVTESEQSVMTMNSALWEVALHTDEDSFLRLRDWAKKVLISKWPVLADSLESDLCTYHQVCARISPESEHLLKQWNAELSELKVDFHEFRGMSGAQIRSLVAYHNDHFFRARADEYLSAASRREELLSAMSTLQVARLRDGKPAVRLESEFMMKSGTVSSDHEEKVMNLTDIMGDTPNHSGLGMSTLLAVPSTLQPSTFFERPIKIATLNVPLNGSHKYFLKPWDALSLDPSVRAKFRNYSLFAADVELTIEVSASMFHYGRVLAGWVPKVTSNASIAGVKTMNNHDLYLSTLSQTRGARVLDIRENKPIKFVLPYINYKPYLRLYVPDSDTPLGSATSIPDFATMGEFWIFVLNQFKASNSTAPTEVTIYVYARFVNERLAGPTASQTIIVTESATEMKSGPVEKMSSALASAMNVLSTVPHFRPWTQPSAAVLRGLSSVASVFGWSVPRIDNTIDVPHLVHNQPYQNNAVTIGRSTAQKLTFDPQQCTNVDPRIVAVEEDELSINFITSIQSYAGKFTWSPDDTSMATVLWDKAVTPMFVNVVSVGSGTITHPTALTFAALPFEFWHGEIEFTFDVVASNLHRGKLLFQFEPNIGQKDIIEASIALNKQHSVVMDLQETQRISICVPWMQPRQWLRVPERGNTIASVHANGFLLVTPFTELQSPDSTPVEVNVFVRSKDICFNQFTGEQFPTSKVIPESGTEFPEDMKCFRLGENVLAKNCDVRLCFGEQPVSFRSFLKRYANYVTESVSYVSGNFYKCSMEIYPAADPAIGSTTVDTDLLSYLRFAYLGMIGSVRKRLQIAGVDFAPTSPMRVRLLDPNVTSSDASLAAFTPSTLVSNQGTLAFVPRTQSGMEIELPLYTSNFFLPSGFNNSAGQHAVIDTNFDPYYTSTYEVSFFPTGQPTALGMTLFEEHGAAEDFTLYRWISSPWFV